MKYTLLSITLVTWLASTASAIPSADLTLQNADPVSQAIYGSTGNYVTAEPWLTGIGAYGGVFTPCSWSVADSSGLSNVVGLKGLGIQPGVTWNGLTLAAFYYGQYLPGQTYAEDEYFAVWQNNTSSAINVKEVTASTAVYSSVGAQMTLSGSMPSGMNGAPIGEKSITIAPGGTYGTYSKIGTAAATGLNYYFWVPGVTVDCGRVVTFLLPVAPPAPTYNQRVAVAVNPASGITVATNVTLTASAVDQALGTAISGASFTWSITNQAGQSVLSAFTSGDAAHSSLAGAFPAAGTYTIAVTSVAVGNYPAATSNALHLTVAGLENNVVPRTVDISVNAHASQNFKSWFSPAKTDIKVIVP